MLFQLICVVSNISSKNTKNAKPLPCIFILLFYWIFTGVLQNKNRCVIIFLLNCLTTKINFFFYMKWCFVFFLMFVAFLSGTGQDILSHNHFFLNPYMYNPAFAGKENRANLALNHRQQWTGIEDAPVTSYISFDIPVESRVNLGTKLINEQRSIMNNTAVLLTLGYTAPFSQDNKHGLSFGISAGIMKQSIDKDGSYNYDDPAVIGLLDNRTHLLGEFGVRYRFYDLNIGLALPTLFSPYYASDHVQFDPLQEVLFMADYNFVISEKRVDFSPHFMYRLGNKHYTHFEVAGIFQFFDTFWTGAAFRQNYGTAALIGLNLGKDIRLGYAYEFATSKISGVSNGSHEIQFLLGLGDPNKVKRLNPRYKH